MVFGFQDVFEDALPLPLPGKQIIKLPRPAGYAVMKMRAWLDRSAYHEHKDANDLATVALWYRNSPAVQDEIYESDRGLDLLTSADYDIRVASAGLLGCHIQDLLSKHNYVDLKRRWEQTDHDLLAQHFIIGQAGKPEIPIAERELIISQLLPAS